MNELYEMPGHLIRRSHQISTALFTEECGGFDLTSVQYAALCAISVHADVDATRISALIAFDRSTISDVLERLEQKGWIARKPATQDKRVKLVRLTSEGAKLLRRVQPAVRRVQARLLAPLATDDRATLVRLLVQLADLHNEVTSAPLRAAAER